MKLEPFFAAQERLDVKVVQVHGLEGNLRTANKLVALYVELGELANEIEFFKDWKVNKRKNEERQRDEWADTWHFALSVGLDFGHDAILESVEPSGFYEEISYETFFLALYSYRLNDINQYKQFLGDLLAIAHKLGMDTADVEKAYFDKNRVNYARLASGY